MKKVYTSSDNILIGFLKGILEDQNIHILVKNEMLLGAVGEIPPIEVWPEIWVMEDRDETIAKTLIEQAVSPVKWQREWQCPSCGEWIESQFSECWKCNSSRPQNC